MSCQPFRINLLSRWANPSADPSSLGPNDGEFVWRRRDALSETIKYIRRTATQGLKALGADEYRRRRCRQVEPGQARSHAFRLSAWGRLRGPRMGDLQGSGTLSALLLPRYFSLTPCAGNT